jgi:hypothetical protein
MQAVLLDETTTAGPADTRHEDDREGEPADGEDQTPEERGYGFGV